MQLTAWAFPTFFAADLTVVDWPLPRQRPGGSSYQGGENGKSRAFVGSVGGNRF